MNALIPILAAVAIIIVFLIWRNWHIERRWKKVADERKKLYDAALLGKDKKVALELGREYYRALRDGNPITTYDEQAIANDLSTMKDVF